MARARNLKPQFFHDAELVECDFWVRLLFQGLWVHADCRGILADSVDIDAGLDELVRRGFIVRYECAGHRCIWIPAFTKHQSPHPKEPANSLPSYQEHEKQLASNLQATDTPQSSKRNPGVRSKEKESKQQGERTGGVQRGDTGDAGFEAFWLRYPRQEPSKKEAHRSWVRVMASEDPPSGEDIMAGLERWLPVFAGIPDKTKIPHATTWLNQARWTVRDPARPANGKPPELTYYAEVSEPDSEQEEHAQRERKAKEHWQQLVADKRLTPEQRQQMQRSYRAEIGTG
jgi:hypothetical protein